LIEILKSLSDNSLTGLFDVFRFTCHRNAAPMLKIVDFFHLQTEY
jgi:hypothetical protein